VLILDELRTMLLLLLLLLLQLLLLLLLPLAAAVATDAKSIEETVQAWDRTTWLVRASQDKAVTVQT
jgi:ABC-type sulfate transport system permease component